MYCRVLTLGTAVVIYVQYSADSRALKQLYMYSRVLTPGTAVVIYVQYSADSGYSSSNICTVQC